MLLLASAQAFATERILSFHADIHVQADGAMNVTETITVRAEGRDIKRGIYRDLPTTYRDAAGRRVSVAYTHIGVLRDGRPEPHHETVLGNGIRIYIGDKNRFLEVGQYTYTLSYRTDRQLGFFDDHDELYWNVTGNGWRFPIDSASASVRLPSSVPGAEMVLEAYTGAAGARGQDFAAMLDVDSVAQVSTTAWACGRRGPHHRRQLAQGARGRTQRPPTVGLVSRGQRRAGGGHRRFRCPALLLRAVLEPRRPRSTSRHRYSPVHADQGLFSGIHALRTTHGL